MKKTGSYYTILSGGGRLPAEQYQPVKISLFTPTARILCPSSEGIEEHSFLSKRRDSLAHSSSSCTSLSFSKLDSCSQDSVSEYGSSQAGARPGWSEEFKSVLLNRRAKTMLTKKTNTCISNDYTFLRSLAKIAIIFVRCSVFSVFLMYTDKSFTYCRQISIVHEVI